MKKIVVMSLYLLSVVYGDECLNINNIKSKIVHISEDKDKVVLTKSNGEFLKEVIFLNFVSIEERILYQDLDFDNKKEILVDISSHERYEEHEIFTINCNKLVPFFPKSLYYFKLNKREKTLTEYARSNNDYRPKFNTYCLNDSKYYLCKREEYFTKDINKTNEFDRENKIIKSYYNFKKDIVSLKETIDKKDVVKLNNIAYYIQKAGANEEAIYLLKEILKKYPNRTVAYYNLGDAYWALGDKKKAKEAYLTYTEQMCNAGKQKRIPKVVKDRISSKKRGDRLN